MQGDAGETDAGTEDAGPPCQGECVPLRPTDYPFSDPHHVWFGPPDAAPTCPEPLKNQFTRYRGLVVPPADCPECTCAPSTGTCAPPSSFTAYAAVCDDASGAIETPFAPPDAWDGSCTFENAVPAGVDCGGVPCVQSLSIGPLQKQDDGCAPSYTSAPPVPPAAWQEVAVACEGLTDTAWGGCQMDEMCIPTAAPGFEYCVFIDGEMPCPEQGYSEQHVFYRELVDTRKCEECSCGGVEGSLCTGTATVFKDAKCSSFLLGTSISSDKGACVDMSPLGQALGSKQVTDLLYAPGTCTPSGGGLSGTAEPTGPVTFCCVP